jgi:hypothetical protein
MVDTAKLRDCPVAQLWLFSQNKADVVCPILARKTLPAMLAIVLDPAPNRIPSAALPDLTWHLVSPGAEMRLATMEPRRQIQPFSVVEHDCRVQLLARLEHLAIVRYRRLPDVGPRLYTVVVQAAQFH